MGISITVDLFHHYQKLRELIGQFAVVDESKENVARVNLSRNGHALKESFYLTSLLCYCDDDYRCQQENRPY